MTLAGELKYRSYSDSIWGPVIAFVWSGFVAMFTWQTIAQHVSRRNLARFGTPVFGQIKRKEILSRRGPGRFRISFRYQANDGVEHDATMDVGEADYNAIEIDQNVTVLYNPNRPKRSMIYCFADYEVIGMA